MHRYVCCLFSLVFGSRLADCLEDASNEPCGLSKPSQLILTRKFVAGCCCCPLLLPVAAAAAVAVILPQHKSNYTHTQAHAAINKVRGHMLNMLYGLCYIRPMPRYTIYGMVYDHTLFFCACVCGKYFIGFSFAFYIGIAGALCRKLVKRQFAYIPLIFFRV